MVKKIGIPRSQCVAVGDTKYDVNFLRSAGLGMAVKKDKELTNVADVVITNLEELLNFV